MARTVFRPKLIEFLVAHEGMVVYLDGMVRALPEGVSEASIRTAMRQIIEGGAFQITTLAAGHSWRVDAVSSTGSAPSLQDWGRAKVKREKAPADKVELLGPFVRLGVMEDGSTLV